eukprot:snap_masked-scaffold_26-processed-gene-0.42-mRNA-1 protein AED:1.00 eAED:1.00 QI:0/0/0/0/1/1/3/0/638
MSNLVDIFIEENNLKIESERIAQITKHSLRNMTNLVNLRIGKMNMEKKELTELQVLIDCHETLILFEITKENYFKRNMLRQRLANYVKSSLRDKLDKDTPLNEAQVFFMGDGRVGKTSTIRTLFDRKFLLNNESTLLLNDIDIFGIDPYVYKWSSISKYDLSVQRVKNSLPWKICHDFDPNLEDENRYQLNFEDEILTRTIADENFIETMKTATPTFNTQDLYFRVYDFGGQEIFSSVHHIFMHSNALYFLVFNMSKATENDLQRMKFWCDSISRNAPEGKIVCIGTFLEKYKRKNSKDVNLEEINKKITKFLSPFSKNLYLLENEEKCFFPIENAEGVNSKEIKQIKNKVTSIVSGASGVDRKGFLTFKVKTSWLLFLDNCREQSNLNILIEFIAKALDCGFDEEEVQNMLEIYSKSGIICYFPNLELEDNENFIFFAPSYLAQAIGKFIRDPSFHQLAFRIPSIKFRLYRKYVDTGILSRELMSILLKSYTEIEKKYILQLAIESLILIPVEDKVDEYVLPELLPPLTERINPPFTHDIEFVFTESVRLSTFVQIVGILQVQSGVMEFLLYKGFSRIILGTNCLFDVFYKTDAIICFSIVQGNHNIVKNIIRKVEKKLRRRVKEEFEIFGLDAFNL